MVNQHGPMVFLAYAPENQDAVEALARRLYGDARLSIWFGPWHKIPGLPFQEQMEQALLSAQVCAIFIGGGAEQITGWQNEQMRVAIQTRLKTVPGYRILPVLLPGVSQADRGDLPPFLGRYEMIDFPSLDDEYAFKRLLAGILGIPPIQVEGYLELALRGVQLEPPRGGFEHGHALVIGVASYPQVSRLPESVLNDARALCKQLTDPAMCGYQLMNVASLIDEAATAAAIRAALFDLSRRTGPDDTAVVLFSGHGMRETHGDDPRSYILPYDTDLADLSGTAISGDEMTNLIHAIGAGRLLVLLDCCHSAGVGQPKGMLDISPGLSDTYYERLRQGVGRVVIASSRADEFSWTLPGMTNSLFTHYLLEALRGEAPTLGDGYVRVFDLFRHVADRVPARATQHPVLKVSAMEQDFVIALAPMARH
jgi:hypothetical protein